MKSSLSDIHANIARRAHEIWEETGRPLGYETAQWLQAERELHEQPDQEDRSVKISPKANQDSPRKVSKR